MVDTVERLVEALQCAAEEFRAVEALPTVTARLDAAASEVTGRPDLATLADVLVTLRELEEDHYIELSAAQTAVLRQAARRALDAAVYLAATAVPVAWPPRHADRDAVMVELEAAFGDRWGLHTASQMLLAFKKASTRAGAE